MRVWPPELMPKHSQAESFVPDTRVPISRQVKGWRKLTCRCRLVFRRTLTHWHYRRTMTIWWEHCATTFRGRPHFQLDRQRQQIACRHHKAGHHHHLGWLRRGRTSFVNWYRPLLPQLMGTVPSHTTRVPAPIKTIYTLVNLAQTPQRPPISKTTPSRLP